MAVEAPTVQGGASKLDDEVYSLDQLGKPGIRVKTDLEQSYGSHLPAACSADSVV